MKLDRNITTPRRGKYALIKLRQLGVFRRSPNPNFMEVEEAAIDFGDTEDTDFFVIRLKDRFSEQALRGYAQAISDHLADLPPDHSSRESLAEYHHEIIELAEAAHRNHHRRIPD